MFDSITVEAVGVGSSAIAPGKGRKLELPSQWNELRPSIWRSSAFVNGVLALDMQAIKLAVLQHYYPVFWRLMSANDVSLFLSCWNFEGFEKCRPVLGVASNGNVLPWMRCAWPLDEFENGTMREFMLMDEILTQYVEGGAVNYDVALKMLALLHRPVHGDVVVRRKSEDVRVAVVSNGHVDEMAAVLRRYAGSIYAKRIRRAASMAVMYALGVKFFVAELYGPLLFDTNSSEGMETESSALNWTSVNMQVAEGGVFGNYEGVLDTQFHTICTYLVVKKREDARRKAAADADKNSGE